MSKAKAKKLIPPIFFKFSDDIGLNFLLKTQVEIWNPRHSDFLYKAWGIEKSGLDTWQFKTHQYEAWCSTKSNRAKIVRHHGDLVNYVYEYVPPKKNRIGKFVRQDVSFWEIERSNYSISLDYGVDELVDDLAYLIKSNPKHYERLLENVSKLANGIAITGRTLPISVDGHGYLKFV